LLSSRTASTWFSKSTKQSITEHDFLLIITQFEIDLALITD
jgi:hypothetical protein